jgi:glycosyltransferase involved in cell wall biosynthesis
MKVAIMIDSLAIGGAQKHVRQLACGLAGRGHCVTVYCLNDVVHPIYREALEAGGVELKVIGKVKVLNGRGLLEVAWTLWRNRHDVLVTVLFVSTLFGRVVAAMVGGIPVVTCLQARNINYTAAQKIALRVTAGLTNLTVTNSRNAIGWAVENEGVDVRRCTFVANALDPIRIAGSGQEHNRPTWTALGFPQLEGKTVIGSLGRLHRQKGYDVLLEAFAGIASTLDACHVLLVGEGPERAALVALAKQLGLEGRVWFAGERAETRPLLEKMAIYVQPSRFEGTPNAVMEAMAAGLPVVASAVDGITELIAEGREGWLVLPEDAEVLAQRLAKKIAAPAEVRRAGENGRARIERDFSLAALVVGYERAIRLVVVREAG